MITIEDVTERLDRERSFAAMLDPACRAVAPMRSLPKTGRCAGRRSRT
jgi:hypothetical protein